MTNLETAASTLLAVFEGPEKLVAYRDTGGVWTIGCGHTLGVKEGDTCTHEQAVAWFAVDQKPLLDMVRDKPPLVGAAYASFGFNCGRGALHAVLSGADTIDNPRHATDRSGKTVSGLVSRRRLEKLLVENG